MRIGGLGRGLMLGGGGKSVVYLLRDLFYTDRVAGAVNGTTAEPGGTGTTAQKTRAATDTASHLSISRSIVEMLGASDWGNPGLWLGGIARQVGQLLVMQLALRGACNFMAGWDEDQAAVPTNGFWFPATATESLIRIWSDAFFLVGTMPLSATFELAFAMRATGVMYFIRGGGYTNWTLLWIDTNSNAGTMYPCVTQASESIGLLDLKVPVDRWLPTPLISDGFGGAYGTSDGAGHAEATGIGAGGANVTIADSVGTWGVAAGKLSAAALDGGRAIALSTLSTPDVFARIAITRGAGASADGLVFRRVDANNYAYVTGDGTNITVRQVVATVDSEVLAPTAYVYGAGGALTITAQGNTAQVYYNSARIGADLALNAALANGAGIGPLTGAIDVTFDNFVVYARSQPSLNKFLSPAPSTINTLLVGDSKTTAGFTPANNKNRTFAEVPTRFAHAGFTTAALKAAIDADIAAATGTPEYICLNIGANDIAGVMPAEADFKTDLTYILDALNTEWPAAKIYVMRPWVKGDDADSDTLDGWIDTVIATRPTFAYAGPDERVFIKSTDNGATYMSVDNIHPNSLGYALTARQWTADMGL